MTAAPEGRLPFDEVLLVGPPERRIPPSEFFALPMGLRLRHVISRSALFFSHGEPVDAQQALAQVRALRLAS